MDAAPTSTIALMQSSSLSQLVQQEIERAILMGEYPPGSKLTEAALAERLGVSRGPVREAFRMLDEAGLVRSEKNRGVYVRDIPVEEAAEIFDLRAAMEEVVGRQLAAHLTPAQHRELLDCVAAMERTVQAQDAPAYHRLNLQFHDRLVEMAGNRKLAAIYRKLIKELSLFRRLSLTDEGSLPASAGEHQRIVEAIASGDPVRAARTLFDHAMESKQRALAHGSRRPHPATEPDARPDAVPDIPPPGPASETAAPSAPLSLGS